MKIYKFPRGGIVFEDSTVPPRDKSVIAFLPVLAVVPLIQHSGGKALPLVNVGDQVQEGMLIARRQSPESANIHAPIPGTVIQGVSWEAEDGFSNEALVIRLGGAFEKLGKPRKEFHWEDLKPFALQQLLGEYGVVEMEPPGRPLADLLGPLYSRDSDEPAALVVRCVFDDPWLAGDYALCRDRAKDIAEGACIVCHSAQINRLVFAVSHREYDLGSRLLEEAGSFGIPGTLVAVSSRYPQKNPRELQFALREYEKKEGQTLGSLLILSPATLAGAYDAIKLKKPVLERYIGVGGSAVKNPQVMRVRIGTRLKDLFAECGGFVDEPQRVILGSPLSGRRIASLDEPVVKTSFAAAALLEPQTGGTVMRKCIACGECRQVCPAALDPESLFKGIQQGRTSAAAECHGCGCCDLACPSRLPLSKVIQIGAIHGKTR
ncbi:MAG: SLBB domain-containing protein [Spirochaetaceae bacterium]|jgi:electron transport complex protein RnfC|nr:SLBB domain-containing protein [Spirochaetaceae bacterium]